MAEINFLGKGAVYAHHLGVPYRALEADAKKSVGQADLDGNLIIHGDNLEALKALLPRYEGQVKCIYIDPPYNTGNEGWKYNDNVNSPTIKDWLGKAVDGEDQSRHDKWLSMMWPRLSLLHQLLAEDGVIFISIDDNEVHRLRAIMDEIFGEDNFITNIVWQKKYAPANDAKYFSDNHDFLLCYAKTKNQKGERDGWQRNLLPRTEKENKLYKHNDKDGKGLYRISDLSVKTYSEAYDYPIINPKTGEKHRPPQGACWRTRKETVEKWIEERKVFFGKSGKGRPQLKRYLNEVQQGIVPLTIWPYEEVGHTDGARKAIKDIFHDRDAPFDNPKPVGLINRVLQLATDKDSIILDSFAGSGTTAHAVLALNKEEGGNRKFILVECEDYADKITAERVRRVIKGMPAAKDEALKKGLGGSFTYCALGETLDPEKMLTGEALPSYAQLARHLFWLATGKTLKQDPAPRPDWLIGKTDDARVHLIYQPNLPFLQSKEADLTFERAEKICKAARGRQVIVFAAAAYPNLSDLKDMKITFAQLPGAIHDRLPTAS